MHPHRLLVCVGLCASAAAVAVAGDKPELQRLDNAFEVTPQRVARVRFEHGAARVVSAWADYSGGASRAADVRVFDCFGDNDSDGFMDDTGGCFTASNTRYFFGTSYCNMFVSADHTVWEETDLDAGFARIDFAWQWTCRGFGTEPCLVAVFTQDSVPCDPDSFDYSGWVFDFGTLSCNPGGYYYTNATLSTGTWPIPTGGTGSHILYFASGQTSSGGLALATCAQPMLWGTEYGGDNQRGTQVTEQYDDDVLADGEHTISECHTYSFGFCPGPLGAMVQLWGEANSDPCDYANYNGDSTVNTQDFLDFLNSWNAGEARANCNGDSTVNTQDFLCFLNIWNACR